MKIIEIKTLIFPEIKVIKFAMFKDNRGYFTEIFRKNHIKKNKLIKEIGDFEFVQCNESFSKKGTFRGFHFQWNPYMGKLVRVVQGNIIDMALDIRKNSPNFGKVISYNMRIYLDNDFGEWIWIPPGFAHGIFYLEDTTIVYFCTSEYNPACEAAISPFATDINWSLFNPQHHLLYQETLAKTNLISEKDKKGFTISDWSHNPNSNNFLYGRL